MTGEETATPWREWPVGSTEALEASGAFGFVVGHGDWPFRGFVVQVGGDLRAYANICPHRTHPLDTLPDQFLVNDGRLIRCGSHGALFEPGTGKCVFGPCVGQRLLALELRVAESGVILVCAPDSLQEGISAAQSGA